MTHKLLLSLLLLTSRTVAQVASDYKSCAARNFSGCCTEVDCTGAGTGEICWCDHWCFDKGDCCPDITDINCTEDAAAAGSCVQSNFSGCCQSGDCKAKDGAALCYCNQSCYSNGDCCYDVQAVGCYPPATEEPGTGERTEVDLSQNYIFSFFTGVLSTEIGRDKDVQIVFNVHKRHSGRQVMKFMLRYSDKNCTFLLPRNWSAQG